MRHRPHPSLRILLVVAALLLLVGGLVLEGSLGHATREARAGLEGLVARAPHHDSIPQDEVVLERARDRIRHRDFKAAAALLAARTSAAATSDTHALAARSAAAAGRFDDAARHDAFAARLERTDAAAARAERSVDRALLARLRGFARIAALLGSLALGIAFLRRLRRRRRARRLASWMEDLSADLSFAVDGPGGWDGEALFLRPEASSLALDVFLRPGRAGRKPPRPGPALSVILSHASSNTSVRLRPRRDVHEDAVRIRIRDDTLRRVVARPGTWRVQARLDGRTLADARIEVAPRVPARGRLVSSPL